MVLKIIGSEAPTLSGLKEWLRQHPNFDTVQPGMVNKTTGTIINPNQKSTINLSKSPGINKLGSANDKSSKSLRYYNI